MTEGIPTYRIRDWGKHFENHESRKVKSLAWVPVKNKHDGAGYRRVAALPNSVQVFCGWCLIVQVASRMPTRGVLRDDDGALDPCDLASKTGFPESVFKAAFEALVHPKIRWLELVVPGESPGNDSDSGRCRDAPGDAGTEQKGTEQKSEREHVREAGDWPERIRAAYPIQTHQWAAIQAIRSSLSKGDQPEVVLQGVRECAAIIRAAEQRAGGPIRWVPNPQRFFEAETWREPERLEASLQPKGQAHGQDPPQRPTMQL